jgi:hypothetical protein
VELYNKFWNFFQHSAPQIHGIEDMEHPLLQQLADKLQQIDSHLSFEINKGRLYEASLTAKILKVNGAKVNLLYLPRGTSHFSQKSWDSESIVLLRFCPN